MSVRRRVGVIVGAGLLASGFLGAQSAAAAPTCGMNTGLIMELDRDLLDCPGDGLVVDRDDAIIRLNGHTISGRGTGIGINFNGHRGVEVEGAGENNDWPIGGASDQAVISDFGTGVVMDGRRNQLRNVTVEFTTNNGVDVTGDTQSVSFVTVSNAGGIGIDKPRADTQAAFYKVKVFSSASDGLHLVDGGVSLSVSKSVFKQNGDDGIRIEQSGEGRARAQLIDTKANYNDRWGVNGVRDVRTDGVKAVGNGQARQCRIVECN